MHHPNKNFNTLVFDTLFCWTVLMCVISGGGGVDLRKKKSERGKLVTLHNVRTVVKPDQIIRVL